MPRFVEELKRRKVFRVAAAYLVAAWVILQVADQLVPILGLPDWTTRLVFLLLVVGFVPALIISWAYELTPEGVVRDEADTPASGAQSPKTGLYVTAVTSVVIVAAAGWWFMGADARWARSAGMDELDELIVAGDFEAAYKLANRMEEILAGDEELLEHWLRFTRLATIPSEPPGATVYRKAYDAPEADWLRLGETPVREVRIPVGMSMLRIELDGYYTQLRTIGNGHLVPDDMPVADRSQNPLFGANPERYLMDPVDSAPADMVRVPGTQVVVGGELVMLDDFFLSRYEVTNGEFQDFVDAGGYQRRDLWRHDFVLDGETIDRESAMARFVDRSARPGPSTWEGGRYPDGKADHPVTGISWYEAAAYARFAGRELPTVHHWTRALAQGNVSWLLPASNLVAEDTAPVGEFNGVGWTGTYDMAGNAREWVFNAIGEDRIILGGGFNDQIYVVQESVLDRNSITPFDRSVTNGLRLMQEAMESTTMAILRQSLSEPEATDLPEPVSDEVFERLARNYDYDRASLNPNTENLEDARYWRIETVSFDAGYDNERMFMYVYLPKQGESPYKTIVFWPGIDGLFVKEMRKEKVHLDFALKNGYAVAYPVMFGTFQRIKGAVPRWTTSAGRSMAMQQVRDFRRAIDYLESRDDIDSSSLAYYGVSWGGRMGPIVLAVEPRLKLGVLNQAGIEMNVHDDINTIHYLRHVTQPVLQFNGRYDADFRYEDRAKPLFDGLATDPLHKKHVVEETGHFVAQPVYIGATLDWLDKYLGLER